MQWIAADALIEPDFKTGRTPRSGDVMKGEPKEVEICHGNGFAAIKYVCFEVRFSIGKIVKAISTAGRIGSIIVNGNVDGLIGGSTYNVIG